MKILLTGSTGFIGRNLLRYYDSTEHTIIPLRGVDLKKPESVTLKLESMRPIIEQKFDALVHCAIDPAATTTDENVRMYDAAKQFFGWYCKSDATFVNIGSGAECNKSLNIFRGNTKLMLERFPVDPYGNAKKQIALDVMDQHAMGRNFYSIRVFGCFGSDEAPFRLFQKFRQTQTGKAFLVDDRRMSYIFVNHLCEMIHFVLSIRKMPFAIYNAVYKNISDNLMVSDLLKMYNNVNRTNHVFEVVSRNLDYTGCYSEAIDLGIDEEGIYKGLSCYDE